MANYTYTTELESNDKIFKGTPLYQDQDIVEYTIEIEYEFFPYRMSFNHLIPDDNTELDITYILINGTKLNDEEKVDSGLMNKIERKYKIDLFEHAEQHYNDYSDIDFDDEI
jgi:hypothetical protein